MSPQKGEQKEEVVEVVEEEEEEEGGGGGLYCRVCRISTMYRATR